MYRTCSFGGLRIFISHGHIYDSPSSAGLADSDFNVVITGHTHVNGISKQLIDGKEVVFLNPGSPSRPRGYSKASYAKIVFRPDDKVSFEIRALNGDRLLSQETVAFKQHPVGDD